MSKNNQESQLIYYHQIVKDRNKDNSRKELIFFKDLDLPGEDGSPSEYSEVDYEEDELLGKFLKKFSISISGASGKKSNEISIYLHNNNDKAPHYEMTQNTYKAYKELLDTMDLVIFTYSNDKKETIEDNDKRLQHLLKYLDKIQEEQGN